LSVHLLINSNCQFWFDFKVPFNLDTTLLKLCELILPSVHFFRVARWFGFTNFITEKKIHSNMLCYTQKWFIHCYFNFWVCTLWNLSPKIKWHWLKFFLCRIFLQFGQFYFYGRQVCNKRLANWRAITDTLTLNGFTRNANHGFTSWKWSNVAWNSSSSLAIYFSILPLCGLQLPLRRNIGSPSDIGKMTESFWQHVSLNNCNFLLKLSCLTCDLGSLSLLTNRADSLVTTDQRSLRRTTRPFAQWNLILAHLQHSKFDIVYTSHSTFETFHRLCVYTVVKLHAH